MNYKYYKSIPAFIILILGVFLSLSLFIKEKDLIINVKNREFNKTIESTTSAVLHEFQSSFSSINFLNYMYEIDKDINKEDFTKYSSTLLNRTPAIKALSWVPKINKNERVAYESRLSKELNSPFTIVHLNDKHVLEQAPIQDIYFPVTFIEPFEKNRDAIGYDIFSDETRKATIIKAISNRNLYITASIKLVQDTSEYGFLGVLPLFKSSSIVTNTEPYDSVMGVITAVFKVNDIINTALKSIHSTDFILVVNDITNLNSEIIYGTEKYLNNKNDIFKREILVGGRKWELQFIVDAAYYKTNLPLIYLLLGLLLTFFVFLLLLISLIKNQKNKLLLKQLLEEKKERDITDKILLESEKYNRLLFKQSPIGLALAKMDGKLIDINTAFAKIIGYSIEEALKLTYWDITPKKYIEQEREQLDLLNSTGRYGPYKKEYIHKDGHLVPVRLQGKIIEQKGVSYIWSSIEDITERKKVEDEFMQSEARFKKMFSNTSVGTVINQLIKNEQGKAVDFKHIDANKAIKKHLGAEPAQIVNTLASQLVSAEQTEFMTKLNEKVVNSGLPYNIEKHFDEFGKTLDISVFHLEGDLFVSTFIDITDRKLAEENIKQLNENLEIKVTKRTTELEQKSTDLKDSQNALLNIVEDLNEKSFLLEESAKKLESANKELEAFTYSVSHDLKAPLRGIDGYSKLLLELYPEILNQEAQSFLNNIRSGTLQMNQLIEDLLAYSRLERTTVRDTEIDVKRIVNDIVENYREEIAARKIKILIDVKKTIILTDYNGLAMALRNLIENAIKFTKSTPTPVINISFIQSESDWEIRVKDNGIGFKMDYHDRIFEIFQRLHHVEDYPGTGIGLALVKKALKRMGGSIRVESKPNSGATFFIKIPKK